MVGKSMIELREHVRGSWRTRPPDRLNTVGDQRPIRSEVVEHELWLHGAERIDEGCRPIADGC